MVRHNRIAQSLKTAASKTRDRCLDVLTERRGFITDLGHELPSSYAADIVASVVTPEFDQFLELLSEIHGERSVDGESMCSLFREAGEELGWESGITPHSRRVGLIAKDVAALGPDTGLSETDYYWGGVLHDIGKLFLVGFAETEEAIELTREEFMVFFRAHAPMGGLVLDRVVDAVPLGATFAWEHQENVEGSGYPRGLNPDEVSIPGRIAQLADVYDAVFTRALWESQRILDRFEEAYTEAGRADDPTLGIFKQAVERHHGDWYDVSAERKQERAWFARDDGWSEKGQHNGT
jgi:hypothetical protein